MIGRWLRSVMNPPPPPTNTEAITINHVEARKDNLVWLI